MQRILQRFSMLVMHQSGICEFLNAVSESLAFLGDVMSKGPGNEHFQFMRNVLLVKPWKMLHCSIL